MSITPLTPATAGAIPLAEPPAGAGRAAGPQEDALGKAAQAFEALFVKTLLDSAFKDGFAGISNSGQGGQINSLWTRQLADSIAATQPDAPPAVNVSDFVDHIDYMVDLIGIDHVGISSDFDGGGGIEGWSDASETFNVTLELVKRGYTEEEIRKLWGGNLLRVMEEVRAVAENWDQED